jgi:predicted TIM-barrel fold metal-dependent hydrolase
MAGVRVRTGDLLQLGSLAEHLEASGKWLLTYAESGIGPLRDELRKSLIRHPDLRIYVPHLGWPRRDGQDDPEWNTAMRELSSIPACIVGISAIAAFSKEPYPHADVQEFAVRLHEFFGASRVIIGSNYPLFQRHMYSQYMFLASQWRQSASAATVTEFESKLFGNQENVERQP